MPKRLQKTAKQSKDNRPRAKGDEPSLDKDEIIGVKVVDTAHMPDPRKANRELPPMEEEKAVLEEPTVADLQKKKAMSTKKPMSANDEGAFNLYIYRVLKEHAP